MMVRVRVFVSGCVQGVGFRHYAVGLAAQFGVRGWVRNRWDGRVEALLEGEKGKVEDLIARIRTGPTWAKVEDMDIRWEDYTGEFRDFRISWDTE